MVRSIGDLLGGTGSFWYTREYYWYSAVVYVVFTVVRGVGTTYVPRWGCIVLGEKKKNTSNATRDVVDPVACEEEKNVA